MDVRLSPEQEALRDSAAQVVDRLGPRTVTELDDPERADKLEAAVAAAGWRELRAPEDGWRELRAPEDGGAPLASGVEAAIVAEELGRRLADAPFLGPTLAAELRRLTGWPVAGMPETVAFGPSLAGPAVMVDGVPPTGALAVDARGATAALGLVVAGSAHGLVRFPLRATEVRTDLTRPVAGLDPSPAAASDGGGGGALTGDRLQRWTALGLALTCADLVGTMRGAVDLTVEYATARRQFGRSVGSFQAVQHLLADAHVVMEGSSSVARHAAWAVDALPAEAALAAGALAKAYCTRAARTVCETSIQVHGGIGNTWECLAHVYLRRALVSGQVLGGTGANLERVLTHHGIGGDGGLR